MTVQEWLSDMPAVAIMTTDVVKLSPSDSLASAADVLLREQITGAPVVEANGRCVGVLSVNDVVGAEGTDVQIPAGTEAHAMG